MIWRLFLVLIGILSSCQKAPKPEKSSTLNLNLNEEPLTLDPRNCRTIKDLTLAKQLFEGLYRLDQKGTPQPALTKNLEISEDKLIYTFTLKEAFWSDGRKITAHDFIYAWSKVLDPKFATDYALMLYPIKNAKLARQGKCSPNDVKIQALDEMTLQVELENPTPYFLELVCFPTTFPIQKALDEANPSWVISKEAFVCNGPFKMAKWEPHFELTLEKNPLYWDQENVSLKNITFTIISDAATESYLFEKGELDWLGQPLSQPIFKEHLSKLKEQDKVFSYPVSGTFWLKFNHEKEPFNDVDIRKAFTMAVERQKIISHVLQGNQSVATSILPPTIATQSTPFFEENKEKAKELFLTHFEEKKCPKITLSFFSNDRNLKIAQVIQEMWREALGVDVVLEGLENQTLRQKVKEGNFMVSLGDWIADYKDPITFLEIFKDKFDDKKGNGMNDIRWYNDSYCELLEKALSEKNPEKRTTLLTEAEAIFMKEMPVCPLYHYAFDYAKAENIENVILSHLGIADFKYAKKR